MSSFSLGNPLASNNGMVYRGPVFVPGAQAAASTQTGQATTLATRGYGVTASPVGGGARTAHWGTVGTGVVAIGLMWFIWWSLPR